MKYNIFIRFVFYSIRENGIYWVIKRLFYELKRKVNWHNYRFKSRSWDKKEFVNWTVNSIPNNELDYFNYWKRNKPNFFFSSDELSCYSKKFNELLTKNDISLIIKNADSIKNGFYKYFSSQKYNMGFPPDWHLNPITNESIDSTLHWNNIPIFSIKTGDIKYIWEIGRFTFTYDLVRAYWLTGDESYAETFWQIIDDWYLQNPPNTGAHWKCGQEISLRLMAICFGLYAFADTPSTTPERFVKLVGLIAVQADRVAKDHVYSSLQFNNHSISEGVGLFTIGTLFPELTISKKIKKMGTSILEFESQRLIFEDGAFAQNSSNYHRLMLMDYLYALQLGNVNQFKFSSKLYQQIEKAYIFLFNLIDESSGKVPNYGGNDGALVLTLNSCDYQDYRPIIASMHYLIKKEIIFDKGPWLEDLIWLFGPQSIDVNKIKLKPKILKAESSGYYTLRSKSSWSMIRCISHNTRPSHADMLHLDIWRNGINIASDPGSYLYYDKPWNNRFMSTELHNTISVDGMDQMDRGPRFMWYNWPKSFKRHSLQEIEGKIQYFEGEHYGYSRLAKGITHRRGVLFISNDTWIIIDDLLGEGYHDYKLHWLLPENSSHLGQSSKVVLLEKENPYGLMIDCLSNKKVPKIESIVGGKPNECYGWKSSYYGLKEKKKSIILNISDNAPIRLLSLFINDPKKYDGKIDNNILEFELASEKISVKLNEIGNKSIVANCTVNKNDSESYLDIIN